MKKILIIAIAFVSFMACQNNKFKVEGIVENTQGETLYLEHTGLIKTEVLDSIKLPQNGKFKLKGIRPEYPDFYRLKIDNKTIVFVVDSTETITINSSLPAFSTEYEIQGSSDSEQIKQLRLSIIKIQQKINALKNEEDTGKRLEKATEIEQDIETHKAMARKIILDDPRSAAAYFALYQQLNNNYLFSPYNEDDLVYWKAVGTSYNTYMPDYIRTKNLYNFVYDVIAKSREEQAKENQRELVNELMKHAKGYIDIALPDRNGDIQSLSDLEGKVVLIDFSAYEAPQSIDYTFALRDLYSKYNKQGFEIYQVSADRNKLLWEISIENIPWVCVRDEDGPRSAYINMYNVRNLPTTFLMDKNGNIVVRNPKFNELEKEIKKLLK